MQHLALSAGFCCLPQGQEQEQQEARRQQAGAQEARGTHQEALAPISHEAGIFTSQSAVSSQYAFTAPPPSAVSRLLTLGTVLYGRWTGLTLPGAKEDFMQIFF